LRRLGVALVIVASLVQPAFADDLSSQQQDVKQRLVAASNQLTQLNLRMADLSRSQVDTQLRIDRERTQVRFLARALYAQPDSVLALMFESASISEAVTRVGDMTSAGDRAAATKQALDRDLARQSRQRDMLQADQERTAALQKQLQVEFDKLATALAAQMQRTPIPAAAPPPMSLAPGSVTAIQQIILDAFAVLGGAAQTWALRVARCESNYNPYAVNRSSGASGLFQFLPSTWAGTPEHNQSVFDPTANANAAAWLYGRSGGSPWSCK
jgi:soluble lytic murein transglycosylase-like protein